MSRDNALIAISPRASRAGKFIAEANAVFRLALHCMKRIGA